MQQYRKKSGIVNAIQFKIGEQVDGVFEDEFLSDSADIGGSRIVKYYYVVTIHGQKTMVKDGDWIITEPDGIHHYPCKPDIFAVTYEPVSAQSVQSEGGLQWVKGAPDKEQQFYARFRTVGDHIKSGLIWPYPDSEPRMWYTQTKDSFCPIMDSDIIEYLDESASPSTANTEEGAAAYIPCGGCGAEHPHERCINCFHDFGPKKEGSKEQQIAFAEWAGAEGFHYDDGCWFRGVGYVDMIGGTTELYELFLTETKQQ